MYWLILVGVFIVGLYWLKTRSGDGTHHDQRARAAHLRLLEQKRIEAETAFRHGDAQRHHTRWRRR
ncbi:MAG: hypothetical protein ACXAC0_03420 [Candidatus Thorarchaeota archaeon]